MPLRISDYIEGGSLMYLCRLGGHQVLTMGSMNFIERELEGYGPMCCWRAPERLELRSMTTRSGC